MQIDLRLLPEPLKVKRIPYPKGFPASRRALIEVAIYEAEELLKKTLGCATCSGVPKEDPTQVGAEYVQSVVLAFATVCVHDVYSGQLPLCEIGRLRDEFLQAITDRVFKTLPLDDREAFGKFVATTLQASEGWKFHLEQVEELTETGELKIWEKNNPFNPYEQPPVYISLMSSSVEQGDIILRPEESEADQPKKRKASP